MDRQTLMRGDDAAALSRCSEAQDRIGAAGEDAGAGTGGGREVGRVGAGGSGRDTGQGQQDRCSQGGTTHSVLLNL
jgi:hypothetical protein